MYAVRACSRAFSTIAQPRMVVFRDLEKKYKDAARRNPILRDYVETTPRVAAFIEGFILQEQHLPHMARCLFLHCELQRRGEITRMHGPEE